jgi:hypothetical protein
MIRSRCSATRRAGESGRLVAEAARLVATAALLLALGLACDATPSPPAESSGSQPGPGDERPATGGRPGDVRARADAAFAELTDDAGRRDAERFETRVGLQPWPDDLPAGWPRPDGARVVADARRGGDRLLLVDLPGSVEQASADYRDALRRAGYAVDAASRDAAAAALRARRGGDEARLDFFDRSERTGKTRLEILFVGGPRG